MATFPIRDRVDALLAKHSIPLPAQLAILYASSNDELILTAARSKASTLKDREWEALDRVDELRAWLRDQYGMNVEFTDALVEDAMELLLDLNNA